MESYSFLKEVSTGWLDIYARKIRVVLEGKDVDRIKPSEAQAVMFWETDEKLVNEFELTFQYPKRTRPNTKWPWPFRNLVQPSARVDGLSLYSGDRLLFRTPLVGGSVYVYPGSTLVFKAGEIKIDL